MDTFDALQIALDAMRLKLQRTSHKDERIEIERARDKLHQLQRSYLA